MENISIKVHPPWYARGTPIINTRDGPPMAESENTDYVIKCRKLTLHSVCSFITISALTNLRFSIFFDMINQNWYKTLFAIREGPSARGKTIKCMNEKGKRVRSGLDFIRLWLTLNTTFFNTKKSVFSQQYARIRQLADETIMERTKIENSQTRRVETIIENDTTCELKPEGLI